MVLSVLPLPWELIDFGTPTYLPIDKRGADAVRADDDNVIDEPPVADDLVALDVVVVGRTYVPDVRNEPDRASVVADVADAAEGYVPAPPTLRIDAAANAALDTAMTHTIDNNDVLNPSLISLPYRVILYHNFSYPKILF